MHSKFSVTIPTYGELIIVIPKYSLLDYSFINKVCDSKELKLYCCT